MFATADRWGVSRANSMQRIRRMGDLSHILANVIFEDVFDMPLVLFSSS